MPPPADSKLLFTVKIEKQSKLRISKEMLVKNWPDMVASNMDTDGYAINVKGHRGATFDLIVHCNYHLARGKPAHRFVLLRAQAQPLIENLGGITGDILGIALSPNGTYTGEVNTGRVLALWATVPHDFPRGSSKATNASSNSNSNYGPNTRGPGTRKATNGSELQDRNQTATDRRPNKKQRINSAEAGPSSAGNSAGGRDNRTRASGSQQIQATHNQAQDNSDDYHTIVNGMDVDEGADPLARRQPLSMPLLPGETPLVVEKLFGEGNPLVKGDQPPDPRQASPCGNVPPMQRYGYATRDHARVQLGWKAANKAGGDRDAYQHAVNLSEEFEKMCLLGESKDTEGCKQTCRDYVALLKQVYGDALVLEPHVLNASVLEKQEGTEVLQLFRCMERRFIIWTDDRKEPEDRRQKRGQPVSEEADDVVCMLNKAADDKRVAPPGIFKLVRSFIGIKEGPGPAAAAPGGPHHPSSMWGAGLKDTWATFVERLKGKTYENVDLDHADLVSCALNDTVWRGGHVVREALYSDCEVLPTLVASQAGSRPGRLYLTDGSMPDYDGQNYPHNAPGMPCGIDNAVNAMMPHAVASNRGTNLFHALKNESTGTRTFTLFAPIGGGTNLTAFHFETKRRRSYNCGSGDLIVQPLATLENIRKLMRVHAAVAGCHSRHGQLLPLECYLEEGIAMVVYMRDGDQPTLCELPEQSMHAFISFADIGSPLPALKVSCNDFDLVWEVDSAYWLEKLSRAYEALKYKAANTTSSGNGMNSNQNSSRAVKVLPGEGFGEDGADTWVQSCYLTRNPRTMTEAAQHTAPAPWLCELQGQEALDAAADEAQHCDDMDLHWGMDVIAVRLTEKLLAVADGTLTRDKVAAWAGELPTDVEIYMSLKKLIKVLYNMVVRSNLEGSAVNGHQDVCQFTHEYLMDLCKKVMDQIATYKKTIDVPQRTYGLMADDQHQSSQDGHSETRHALVAMLKGNEEISQADAFVDQGIETLNNLAPDMLRMLWLVMMESEWKAATAAVVDFELLAKRRKYRSDVELAWDLKCQAMAKALGG